MSANDLDLGWRWVTRRDPGAFQALVSRHTGMVYGTCRRVLGNATEAEDVAQECFEILARTPKWPEGSLGAWLHRVATNRALNRLKSERRRLDREERYARERSPEAEGDWDDIHRFVDEAIADLPDKYRTPLVSCFLEGLSHATIAENLDIPRRTVTHRIGKGVELIRKSLRKRGVPVAAAALTAMLGANLVEAAPASLTASLGRIALAGVKATEAAAAASTAGGLLPSNWLVVGGAVAMWQKISVGLVSIVLVVLASLWMFGSNAPASGSAVQTHNIAGPPRAVRATVAKVPSAKESVAEAKIAVAKALASDGKPTPSDAPATAQGNVIDDAGYPVAGAVIRLEVAGDELGYDSLGVYKAVTDANGDFLIDNIRQFGHEKVYAHRDGYLQAISPELALKPGAECKGIRLILKKARYIVSGWVVDSNRQPIPDAEVSLRHYKMKWPSNGSFFTGATKLLSTFTDAKGWFVIGVPQNAYCDFTVLKDGFGPGFFKEIGTGTDDATFVLKPGGGISGKVALEDGTPVKDAALRAVGKADLGGEPEGLMPAEIRPTRVLTDANGTYRIDGLGVDYVYTVNLDNASVGSFAAQPKTGIEVASAQTTSGVDFTLQGLGTVRVHGKATDGSGQPASPIRVKASVVDPGADFAGDTGKTVNTEPDGSYDLTLHVTRAVDLRIVWSYTDGANVYPKYNSLGGAPPATPGEIGVEVKVFQGLQPGRDETLDFTVTAPIVVPLRFVDPAGNPIEGIEAGLRQGAATWGSPLRSGSDGRAVYRGLGPDTTFRIQAVVSEPERMTVGESEPFAGVPGETLPELAIVCRYRGGVEGVLVDASGKPVADTEIACTGVRDDGAPVAPSIITTNEDGSFVILHGLPYDSYQAIAVGYARDGKVEVGILQNVEITPDTVLNLGSLRCTPMMSVEEAIEAARAVEEE